MLVEIAREALVFLQTRFAFIDALPALQVPGSERSPEACVT